MGYDLHRLVPGRMLVLGGVTIPFEKGLLGHSDADVLVHSICDALLGAAGLGDIGLHYPDSDPKYKDIKSLKLLGKTIDLLRHHRFQLKNIDATIFAEAPKLYPFKDMMAINIADTLNIDMRQVNIKATTAEGLGIIGRGEAMAAMSIVLIE
jgi:2-C-methyl-D-erythritol 2,4-cyclodiphosphate synthase